MGTVLLISSNFLFLSSFTGIVLHIAAKKLNIRIYSLLCLILWAVLVAVCIWWSDVFANKILYGLEYIGGVIWLSVFFKYRRQFASMIKRLNRIEIVLFCAAIIVGLLYIAFLAKSNPLYILPYNESVPIANFYFNADTYRCTYICTAGFEQHLMHPCYRMVLNIFLFPCKIFCRVFGNAYYTFAYYLTFLQVLWNAFSSVLLFRIVSLSINREGKARETGGLIASVMYIVSGAFAWSAILPETYSLTLCLLLLSLYLFQTNSRYAYAFMVLSVGMNPIVAVAFLPFFARNIIEFIKKYKFLLVVPAFLLMALLPLYLNNIVTFRNTSDIFDNLKTFLSGFVLAGFLGPNYEYMQPFFVQESRWDVLSITFLAILITMLAAGVIFNRREGNKIAQSCLLILAAAVVLHVIVGFGVKNGILYVTLYEWAVILLIVQGAFSFRKGTLMKGILCGLIAVSLFSSAKWIVSFGGELAGIQFPIQDWRYTAGEFRISNIAFQYEQNTLTNLDNQQVVAAEVDSLMVSNNNSQISGLLRDGTYFKVSIENGNVIVWFDT